MGDEVVVVVVLVLVGVGVDELVDELEELVLELVELLVDEDVCEVDVGACVAVVTGGGENVVVCLTVLVFGSLATGWPLSAACMKSRQMVAGTSPP